jgi:predicted N-acyltransferase
MPDSDHSVDVRMVNKIAEIPAADWDACACPEAEDGSRAEDPFTTHRFLHALEASGSVGAGSGWQAHHLLAERGGAPIGVMPLYAKGHSQGEYIFDHAFANAWQRSGGRYYPKLQAAVPFTPATGRRLLTRQGETDAARSALLQGMVKIATDSRLSSAHVTFCTEDEAEFGAEMGLLHRITQQFHWENRGYGIFDDFLNDLSSRKRKTIRKERATAQAFGGEIVALTGDAIKPAHWDAFWQFYQDTGARKWGTPYLTRRFFDIAHETMRDDILLVLATRDGRPVAGALNFIGRHTLFGRYWGCVEDHPCMHFELCYYQAIDWALAHGMARVEAGAQGEHKLARGYMPSAVHSLHWFADAGFCDAVARYIEQERDAVDQEMEILADFGPFRKTDGKDAT